MGTNYLRPDRGSGKRVHPPEPDSDSEMETEMAPDHDYCVVPQTGARASNLAEENKALCRQIRELQQQLELLNLRQRFGIDRASVCNLHQMRKCAFTTGLPLTDVSWHFGDKLNLL